MLEQASCEARVPERAFEYIGNACEHGKVQLIRHLPLDQVVHDPSVQSLLVGVMYNSVKPSLKESAIFALGAARNYEWMTYEWLQCNRPLLGSRTNAWKAVLMLECLMKLEGMTDDLSRFRDALNQFAEKLPPIRPRGFRTVANRTRCSLVGRKKVRAPMRLMRSLPRERAKSDCANACSS